MSGNKPTIICPKCNERIPEEGLNCPSCGAKLPFRLGRLTDAQIKRIRKPISIALWVIVALVFYFMYFR